MGGVQCGRRVPGWMVKQLVHNTVRLAVCEQIATVVVLMVSTIDKAFGWQWHGRRQGVQRDRVPSRLCVEGRCFGGSRMEFRGVKTSNLLPNAAHVTGHALQKATLSDVALMM